MSSAEVPAKGEPGVFPARFKYSGKGAATRKGPAATGSIPPSGPDVPKRPAMDAPKRPMGGSPPTAISTAVLTTSPTVLQASAAGLQVGCINIHLADVWKRQQFLAAIKQMNNIGICGIG